MQPAFVSVIIPVLHEAATINRIVDHAFALAHHGEREVIVVDGAPEADTTGALADRPELADNDLLLVPSPPGRARQMNAGAQKAHGNILVFLHADTRLPHNGLELVVQTLLGGPEPPCAGAFSLSIDTQSTTLRVLARLADWRNRLTRTPYGDQVQFFSASVFRELGGFADIPLMEDVEIMRRLRSAGRRIEILPALATTSARRWETEGVWRCSLRNLALRTLYALGASPGTLAKWYKSAGNNKSA